jgi:anti-anti-sigma factor
MTSCQVTHAARDEIHVLRYFGRVDYMVAPAIKQFTDELVAKGGVRALIFDLTQAQSLDSTNLGLLARLSESILSSGGARSVIVSTSKDINSVLHSMCFDEVFEIVSERREAAPLAGGEEIVGPSPAPSPEELRGTMLEAHRTLVALNEAGRLQFQDVVACLDAEAASTGAPS